MDLLLEVISRFVDVRSSRASVTLATFLDPRDAQRVAPHVLHAQDTTAHNILAWLITGFPSAAALSSVFDGIVREDEARAHALAKLREHDAKSAGGFSSIGCFLYSYIPNLIETGYLQPPLKR